MNFSDLTQLQLAIIAVLSTVILVTLFFLILPWFKKQYAIRNLNKIFNEIIHRYVTEKDHYLIPLVKVKLPGNRDVIIDHLVFGDKYIYAIKDLYFEGGLLGKGSDKEWSYYEYKYHQPKYRYIPNPFLLNRQRIEKLAIVTGLDPNLFISVILVNNEAMINRIPVSEDNQFIVNIRQFARLIDAIESRDVPPFKSQILDKAVIDINEMNMKNKKIR
ncbi:MAG: hypothetical protein ACO3BB_02520 [Bacilli bacterium]